MNNLIRFFIGFTCVLLLISAPVLLYYALDHRFREGGRLWLLCIAIFCLPVSVFHRRIRVYLYLLIPLILLSAINLICVVFYNVPLNYDIFLLALNTNLNESTELLGKSLFYFSIFFFIYGVVYFFIVKYIPKTISFKGSLLYTGLGAVFIVCMPLLKPEKQTYINRIKFTSLNVFPGTVYYAIETLARRISLINQHKEFIADFKFNAQQVTPVKQRQIYVLIIGESSRYYNWQINGYNKPTSPRLKKRTGLISFSNMVTGGYITEFSVPMLITTATAVNYEQHYHEKSIVSAFKEAGFNTYWISNQVDFGDILMHAKEADHTTFLSSDYKARKGIHRDMELIRILETVVKKDTGNIFAVVHTLGSHYDYDARYPRAYNIFKPSAKGGYVRPTDFWDKEKIVNSYNNSILYTDAVIDSAISVLNQTRSCTWLSYVADHGENLFDDQRHLSQHGYSTPTKYVAHIPWFIWMSEDYKNDFTGKVASLLQHQSSALGSENVFNTLSDLGNIKFPKQRLQESACSPLFKPEPQLILAGESKVFNYRYLDTLRH
jgi:glucan phosphoethanolaminetransferase (alkaline phosphatase superfamily)